jgi:hypothetical protein
MSSSDEETSTLVDEDDYSINQGRKRRDSTKSKKNKPASRKKPRPPSGKRRKSQSSRKPKGRNRKEREPAPSSRVERLAKRIEGRQNGRVEITLDVRKAFVKGCRKLADRSGAKEGEYNSEFVEPRLSQQQRRMISLLNVSQCSGFRSKISKSSKRQRQKPLGRKRAHSGGSKRPLDSST